jgi:hypothetical protein
MLNTSLTSFVSAGDTMMLVLPAIALIQEVFPFKLPDIDEATAEQVLAIFWEQYIQQ